MNKEFVNYNSALALKELGFDEPCLVVWPGIENQKLGYDGRYFSLVKGYKNSKLSKEVKKYAPGIIDVAAPLYQQAFRWFREKYKLQHHIWSGKLNHIFYGYDILNIEEQELVVNNSDIGGGDCDYDTYEEAEQACLDKLIKLVKNE